MSQILQFLSNFLSQLHTELKIRRCEQAQNSKTKRIFQKKAKSSAGACLETAGGEIFKAPATEKNTRLASIYHGYVIKVETRSSVGSARGNEWSAVAHGGRTLPVTFRNVASFISGPAHRCVAVNLRQKGFLCATAWISSARTIRLVRPPQEHAVVRIFTRRKRGIPPHNFDWLPFPSFSSIFLPF